MKCSCIYGVLLASLCLPVISYAQFKNQPTKEIQISTFSKECRTSIEKQINKKNIAQITWASTDNSSVITYVPSKISEDSLLKELALLGYDNALYLAPGDTYASLAENCKYTRDFVRKPVHKGHDSHAHSSSEVSGHSSTTTQHATEFDAVMSQYMALKNALIKGNQGSAKIAAEQLTKELEQFNWKAQTNTVNEKWQTTKNKVLEQLKQIQLTQQLETQRQYLGPLSNELYPIIQQMPMSKTIYYQACPMYNNGKEANWFSYDSAIQNPFYGNKMLSCGSTINTLKND